MPSYSVPSRWIERGAPNSLDRHAEAAIAHGQDDALALAFAGFVIGMDKHDRAAAFAAFEAARSVSPSLALTYILGSLVLGFGGEAERAIEWSERALRLSPFDPWRSSSLPVALSLGRFLRGEYNEAADAVRMAVQSDPGFSIAHMMLAAMLAKLDRLDDAKVAAARALELQPGLRFGGFLAGVKCAPVLAASLTETLRPTGLPE